MTRSSNAKSGGQLLVECLVNLGVQRAFGVPGESYLAVLDALHDVQDKIEFVLCRQEGGAAYMAAAHGKLMQSPGVCFVTRGPGATNASIGVHTAAQDSVPMILFVGQVATHMQGREAFQEIDYRAAFGSVAKWVTQIDQVDRLPELLSRAWTTAISGRPGPVVVALPEDVLTQLSTVQPLSNPFPLPEAGIDAETKADVMQLLGSAKQPVILYGGCQWSEEGSNALQQFAEQSQIPVVSAFRYIDQFDNHSAVYCGEAGVGMLDYVKQMLREADLIIAINVRFGEMTTAGYTLFDVPQPLQSIIHVHASVDEIGKIYRPVLGVHCGPNTFAKSLSAFKGRWQSWGETWRKQYEGYFSSVPPQRSPVDMVEVCAHLRKVLPADAIITNGAGNFTVWPGKFLPFSKQMRLLAPQSGAMGYGVPASIAASLEYPGRCVLCFAGDGDFQMNSQELATAAQCKAGPIILIVNNGIYGTIRAHQEMHYPERVFGTTMVNPDFVALAKAYGFYAERVENTADFPDAFSRAIEAGTGAVLDLVVSPDAITPFKRIDDLRNSR